LIKASQILEQISCILSEAITSETIDKWEKEYFTFAEAPERIQDGEDLQRVAKSFGNWIDSFVDFLENNLIGAGKDFKNYLRYEPELQEWIKELKYNYKYSLYPVDIGEFLISHKTNKDLTSSFLVNHQVKSPFDWDEFFLAWKNLLKRGGLPNTGFQETGNFLFKTLRKEIDIEGSSIPDLHLEEVTSVGPVKVFTYRAEERDTQEKELRDLIVALKFAINKIKDHGFEEALEGSKVVLDRQAVYSTDRREGKHKDASAVYINPTDTIEAWVVYEKSPGDFIHEFGHRYYRRVMSDRQQKAWYEFRVNNSVEVTRKDVDRMIDALWTLGRTFKELSPEDYINRWKDQLEKSGADENLLEKFIAMGTLIRGAIKYLSEDPEKVKPEFVYKIEDHLRDLVPWSLFLFKHPISSYGAMKAPEETYAEVFRLYCEDKPISEIVRVEFERISGLK
jgi:hypothetical protein